jgi:hypothetical protein
MLVLYDRPAYNHLALVAGPFEYDLILPGGRRNRDTGRLFPRA